MFTVCTNETRPIRNNPNGCVKERLVRETSCTPPIMKSQEDAGNHFFLVFDLFSDALMWSNIRITDEKGI